MAFERVLVAYDGSRQAQAAVRFAFTLTAGAEPEVTIVHVVESPGATLAPDVLAGALQAIIEEQREEWAERLAELAAEALPGRSVATTVRVARRPAVAILELAAELDADLVVLGSRGMGTLRGLLLGSVSQRVLEESPRSVLVVRGEEHGTTPTVVAGVDGSEETPAVVDAAQDAAVALGAELVLAYVVEPLAPGAIHPSVRGELGVWAHGIGERALADARARVTAPVRAVSEVIRDGYAAEELVAVCEERGAALVVIGGRGRHAIAGLLLGSTARSLAQAAPCPVLTVRQGDHDSA